MYHDPLRTALSGAPLSLEQARSLALELFVAGYMGQELPADYAQLLADGLAGAILFKRNLVFHAHGGHDLASLTAHTAAIHAAGARHGELPIFCSVDQEGGPVQRLRAPFTVFPPMRDLGERGDVELVRRVGRQLGRECLAAGFNVDYAPVLDVDTNPANPVIGRRSFSRDPVEVARLAGALLDGLQEAGVAGCGKHFPGHGDTDADSHLTLPVLPHDLARLEAVELVPFVRLAPRLPMVMTAHVLFPALDPDLPATLSAKVLRPLLRERCGFEGVVVSDDLEMRGVASVLEPGACVRAGLAAGCDLFLVCSRRDVLDACIAAATDVLRAPAEDGLRLATLAAVARVRRLRQGLQRPRPDAHALATLLADAETQRLRGELGAGSLAGTVDPTERPAT
jgi:beta-N-acetylhexosaminidase